MSITSQKLADAETDLNTLDGVVNGSETPGVVQPRRGTGIKTLRRLLADIVAAPPGGWLNAFANSGLFVGPRGPQGQPGSGPLGSIFTPEMFGAVGDGTANDQAAFTAMSAAVNAAGGGVIVLGRKTYRVGFQYRAGAFYLFGGNVIDLKDCDAVVIQGNGAVLKFRDGMKYGAFDPNTGQPFPSQAPYYDDGTHRADLGHGVYAWNIKRFAMSDVTFDLNVQKLQIGGEWGDIGRQCSAYGYFVRECLETRINSVHVRNSPLDGGSCAQYGLVVGSPPRPTTLTNCTTDTVARNGFSVLGTNAFRATNCSFDNSGSAPNDGIGNFGTAPGSGVDVEAEGGPCRNITFDRCRFGAATGNTFVADSGDTAGITFRDCEFNGIFWTSKAFTRAYNCSFTGAVRRFSGGYDVAQGATLFSDCSFYGDRPGDLVFDSQGSGYGTFAGKTKITIAAGGVNARGSYFEDTLIEVVAGATVLDAGGLAGYFEGTWGAKVRFTSPAGPKQYWLKVGVDVRIHRATADGLAYWGQAGPTFQGRLYYGTIARDAAGPAAALAVEYVGLGLFGARVGDFLEVGYTGSNDGAMFSASVKSDDVVTVGIWRGPNASYGAGSITVRLAKERL